MNKQAYYRVSVKGIVIDQDGRILLARESDNTWDMLGGGLDHNEDPKDCLKREVQEETGLIITHISESPRYFITAERPDKNVFIANVIYEIELNDLAFTSSDECEELRFLSIEDMQGVTLAPNVQKLLQILTQPTNY